jgi:hypothetical protein
MGLEFINKVAGSIRKSRDKNKAKLERELTPIPDHVQVLTFEPLKGFQFSNGQSYEVCLNETKIELYYNRKLIGLTEKLAPSILEALKDAGGKTIGFFEKLRRHSNQIDVTVKFKKPR